MSKAWGSGSTRQWRKIRLHVLNRDGWICKLCSEPIDPSLKPPHDYSASVHHLIGKANGDDPRHLVAAHRKCNNALGSPTNDGTTTTNGTTGRRDAVFPDQGTPGHLVPSVLSLSPERTVDGAEVRPELLWSPATLSRYSWLTPFLEVPEDASPPLAMSPPPEDAVGSYGADAITWIEKTQRITLRWWQRLAITRQLEHREDGSLCHRTVVESCPRRAGKSVRIRGMALWRMENADLFQEPQLILHTGSDVAICREIQRGAWRWSEEVAGWTVSRANGKEAIESPEGDRWLVRAQRAVYGYDVCLGVVDEGWNVAPDTLSEGLEPAILERSSPQIHLTSTAHRKATSLMRTALTYALSTADPETLLLLWAARPGSDPSDPEVWRAASPHWSEDRRKMIAAKYEKALSGEDDPEFDDPDPLRGFEAQYLNVWHLRESPTVGDPLTSEEAWGELTVSVPGRVPDAVAVEDWFTEGVSVAEAWHLGSGRACVRVTAQPDLDTAVEAIAGLGFKRPVAVGASIAEDPAWEAHKVRTEPRTGTVRAVVGDLGRLLSEGVVVHDGGAHLTGQVLALRTSPGVDGPRIRSTSPADAVKAAVWAVHLARTLTPPLPRSQVF